MRKEKQIQQGRTVTANYRTNRNVAPKTTLTINYMGLAAFYFIIFEFKLRNSCEGSSENHFISTLDHLCFISVKTIIYEHRWQLNQRRGSRA